MITSLIRSFLLIQKTLLSFFGTLYTKSAFKPFATNYTSIKSLGIPFLQLKAGAKIVVGKNLKLNNGEIFNPIGRQSKCVIEVISNAELILGGNIGISSSCIICSKKIVIGNNVKIGGNVCIYDTDFHSLDYLTRRDAVKDKEEQSFKEVNIGDDVFIGAHSIILKGVSIGSRSIVGAGSVVAKSIPADEIWGGNPAAFIRQINHTVKLGISFI